MQDGDRDALHLPIIGDTSTAVHQEEPSNRLLVVAALAAIFLAGSAIVYRTRPLYSLIGPSQSTSGQKDAAQKAQKVNAVEGSHGADKGIERGEGGSTAGAFETGTGAHGGNNSPLVPGSPSKMADEFDTKEFKSSRSKDRRRRGKDPLKEILKSEKKSRGLGSPTISAKDPSFAKSPAGKDTSTPSSPMVSLFSDPQLARLDNGKNSKTKRAAQREKSNIGPDDTTSQAHGTAPGTTSVTHFRGTSESISTSDNSQRQHLTRRLDSPSSSSASSQTLSTADYHQHPYPSHHNRPPSSSASDDGFGRPLSSMSMSTTSSAASGLVNNVDHQDEVPEWNTNDGDIFSKERRNRVQARQLRLASKDDEGEHLHRVNDNNHPPDPSSFASGTSPLTSSYPASNSNSTSRSTSSSVSVSNSTETTNPPASMSSSLVLSTEEVTPATSPTLSHDSVSSKTILALKGDVQEESDEVSALNDKRVALFPSFSYPVASSSHSADTAGVSLTTKRNKSRKASQQTATSSTNKGSSHNPWDWDGAGDAPSPSPSPSYLAEGNTEHSKDKDVDNEMSKDKETHQKPPRLQSGSATLKGTSFSAVAASHLPASSTHPTSLFSPTSSGFGQSIPGSGLTAPLSATPGGASANRASPSLGSDSGLTSSDLRERDEEEAFTFPTLNPITMIAGPSRARSSDINNNNNNNISATYNNSSTSRRAPTPRRPTSPLRNSHTPPPPHPSSSSSSSPHLGHSNLVNSPTSHSGSNGNTMPALSTQTQLASLRGALEAARLREEKNKQEIERHMKEMEMLKWENVNWRRGEVELQTHIRHLMHQLQSYAALFASVAPQLQQQQQQQTNGTGGTASPANAGSSTSSTSATPNGYGPTTGSNSVPATPQISSSSVLSPTPQQPQSSSTHLPPLHIQQMLSNMQMNGLSSPGGVVSPISMSTPPLMGMHPGASPSFFPPYVVPPHQHTLPHPMMVHAQHIQYMQQQQYQQGSAQPSPHQANIFSTIFPPGPPPLMSPHQQHQYSAYSASQQAAASTSTSAAAGNPYGSGPSSAAGSSGSLSPDLTGSPTPGGLNGKRRARTRTQTASGGLSSRAAWDDVGDGWVGVSGPEEEDAAEEPVEGEQAVAREGVQGEDEDEYAEGEFNSILADAILKRPASIRVRSSSRRGKLNMEKGNDRAQEEGHSEDSMPAEKAEPEQLTEFTFPSLSNLGNVNYKSDVIAVNGGLSSSSSSVASPSLSSPAHVAADSMQEVSNKQAVTEVEPIYTDNDDVAGLAEERVLDVLPDALESTSNSESDTTPRKEISPDPNLTAKSTNTEHEHDLVHTQGTEETNGLRVEQ